LTTPPPLDCWEAAEDELAVLLESGPVVAVGSAVAVAALEVGEADADGSAVVVSATAFVMPNGRIRAPVSAATTPVARDLNGRCALCGDGAMSSMITALPVSAISAAFLVRYETPLFAG
jgi:hypothetical protein